MIRVARDAVGLRDLVRSYAVLVDGVKVAKVGRGRSIDVPVTLGHHTVRVAIAWLGSGEWGVDLAAGEVGSFVCRPSGGPFALGQLRSGSPDYIDLRPASE